VPQVNSEEREGNDNEDVNDYRDANIEGER